MMVALTFSGWIYKRHFESSGKSADLIRTLAHVQPQIPGKIILIWNWVRTHMSQMTPAYPKQHPEILIDELPPHALQL